MNIDWSKSHNGVMLCTIDKTYELMPEVKPVIDELIPHLEHDPNDYVVDVKVHMLMPGEYPCIPNWHQDFVPRDMELNKKHKEITGDKMYLWTSGAPYTQFKKEVKRINTPFGDWIEFDQRDVHRGIKSEVHTWRCFIRLIPVWFIHPSTTNIGELRRHSQVYIEDPNKFRW